MDVMYRLTLKVGRGRGLVGEGVEDLVDLGVEIWLFETPFTTREEKKTWGMCKNMGKTRCLRPDSSKVASFTVPDTL